MTRKRKILGLMLVAAMAVSAVTAVGAQGESAAQFTRADEKKEATVITGHQEGTPEQNRFTITTNGGFFPERTTTCEVATYEGTALAPTESITVTPHYANCQSGGNPATIHLNGCHYEFHAGTYDKANDVSHGTVDIECPGGGPIQVTSEGCTVDIPAQTALSTVTFENKKGEEGTATPNDWVTADVNVTDITYNETDTPGCALFGDSGHRTDAEFVSTVKIKGYEDEGETSDPNTSGQIDYVHGKEIGIDVR